MTQQKRILVSGSSGFVGSSLCKYLQSQKVDVWKLVRTLSSENPENEIFWDPENEILDAISLENFDAIIHLGGENIMGRWTEKKKQRILDSRIKTTRFLVNTFRKLKNPPKTFLCASAIGYYGDRSNEILSETSLKGGGFLSDVCEKWETEAKLTKDLSIRTVCLRFGLVLSKKGGALKKMLPLFKLGLGGQIGDGKQYVSWIHLTDLMRIIDFVLSNESLIGSINVVSPEPITNREFTKSLGEVLKRPTYLTLPKFLVNLILGQCGKEVLLSSQRVIPAKLLDTSFKFQEPDLKKALRNF